MMKPFVKLEGMVTNQLIIMGFMVIFKPKIMFIPDHRLLEDDSPGDMEVGRMTASHFL